MKYNLINKITVMIACTFMMTAVSTHCSFAEETLVTQDEMPVNPETSSTDVNDELLGLDEFTNTEDNTNVNNASVDGSVNEAEQAVDPAVVITEQSEPVDDIVIEQTEPVAEVIVEQTEPTDEVVVSDENPNDVSFLNNETPEEDNKPSASADDTSVAENNDFKLPAEENNANIPQPLLDVQTFPEDIGLDALETDASKAQIDSTAEVDSVIPEIGDDRTPFESFGNSILAKVDNDLFNQMSNIEKQTTLLRLELRREELKSRVEALRNARLKAQQEEESRQQAEKEKEKDLEANRQAMIVTEQEKLKQREIELEKVRQAKVVKDYMNEMLAINQQWIAKTAKLQKRINDLEAANKEMHQDFRNKISDINTNAQSLIAKSEEAVVTYKKKMEALNSHINQLKTAMTEREDEIKQLSSNPFSETDTPSEDAIDMSKDYAIMDITGKGDDIIAKIVSNDGKTFIVHKGSKLKNGEVVTSITDHYISFENDGVRSFLYTGGTVMEFEPVVSFNDSGKTPAQAQKSIVKGNKDKDKDKDNPEEDLLFVKKPKNSRGNISFGSGTFAK